MTYRVWKVNDAPAAPAWSTTSDRYRPYSPAAETTTRTDPHRFPIALGVNETTGRVQWCAGCRYVKVMILVPIALAPVLLVLLLFSRLGQAGSVHHAEFNEDDTNRIDDPRFEAPSENPFDDRRCTAIRYSMTETGEDGERDLLRDVRTSYVPPDYVYVPPYCGGGGDWADDSPSQLNEEEDGDQDEFGDVTGVRRTLDDVYGHQYDNYYYRRRREAVANETVDGNGDNALEEVEGPTGNADVIELSARPIEGTPDQIRATQAEIMRQYMDTTVDPCDDFYQYACGNWEKLNSIPKDKAAYDTFEMLRENLDEVLKELLMGHTELPTEIPPVKKPADIIIESVLNDVQNTLEIHKKSRLQRHILRRSQLLRDELESFKADASSRQHGRVARDARADFEEENAEEKAKKLYKSCMNYELLERRGIEPLLTFLDSLGGWPALNGNWSSEGFDWLNLTATLKRYNNDILIVEWVGADIKNSNVNVIQFDQTSFGLPTRDYFLLPTNANYLNAYKMFMQTIIQILGTSEQEAKEAANEIVAFETELAKITLSPEDRTNVTVLYNKMTIGELSSQIPKIDWLRYLSIVQQRPVNASEIVVMYAMDYMQSLVALLDKSPPKAVANYLLWRFVRHRVNNLDDRFQEAKQKFFFVLFGREQSPLRWKTCVGHVNSNMGMALGAMFVRKYFDENSKKDTLDMTYELQQSFRDILNTTEWLDQPTRHFAEMKVNAMTLRIGYPDFILVHKELNEKFRNLHIATDEYFENTLRVLKHLASADQAKLGEVVNRTTWHTAPAVVNAYYSRNKNQIIFPAGILQPPFYHRHFPKSLNYGGIGVVIGHELTHGFDDKGRLFDMEGNMWRWWSDAAIEGFHKRARCLVAQYSNYTVAEVGVAVDGESTQGENIADNGGLKQSYKAYTQWLEAHRDNKVAMQNEQLPGMNATNTQLFFLNFAQVWCGAMRPEATRNKLKTAVHSPGRFRVIGTLSNSEEFAKEFQCALGSPMNPDKKCRVW